MRPIVFLLAALLCAGLVDAQEESPQARREALIASARQLIAQGEDLPKARAQLDEAGDTLALEDQAPRLVIYRLTVQAILAQGDAADDEELVDLLDTLERSQPLDPFSPFHRARWELKNGNKLPAMVFANAASRARLADDESKQIIAQAAQMREQLIKDFGDAKEATAASDKLVLDYYKKGQHSGLLALLTSHLIEHTKNPSPTLLIYRGDAWNRLNEHEKAVADFAAYHQATQKTIASWPHAESNRLTGRHAQAADLYAQIIARVQKENQTPESLLLTRYAQTLTATGQLDPAAEHLNQADHAPGSDRTLTLRQSVRGDLLLARGQREQAIAQWQEAFTQADIFDRERGNLEKKIHDAGAETSDDQRDRAIMDLLKHTIENKKKEEQAGGGGQGRSD